MEDAKSHRCCTVCKLREGPMFSFPKNPNRRELWRQLLGLEQASDFAQICARHFRPEDVKKCNGLYRVVKRAQPCPAVALPRNTTPRAAITTCIVPGCRKTACDDTTLHYLPRLHERRRQWSALLGLGKVPPRNNLICSNHFLPKDFNIHDGKKTLVRGAVPSVNLPDVSLEPERSPDSEDGGDITENPVEDPTSNDEEYCPMEENTVQASTSRQEEDFVGDNLSDSENVNVSSATLSSSQEGESVYSDETPCAHEKGPLDADDGQSWEEAINDAGDEAATLSGIFKRLSSRLKEDIANISESSFSSKPNDNEENSSAEPESNSSQTGKTAFNLFDLISDDTQLKAFTGVTFATFHILLQLLLQLCGDGENNSKYPMRDRLLLTLCKLRLNLSYECLCVLVGIPRRMCGKLFGSTLHLLAVVLQHLVHWPTKEQVSMNMPKCFKKFANTRVVLDCTEVPVCSPDCLKCRIRLYSHYKGGATVKVLVGVAPSGMITFISKVYGGRASDKQIFEESDLITKDLLVPYVDAVMVDKGFRIDAVCDERGIKIHRPPFVQKKQPLTPQNAKLNADIANARVHVERVIQRIKIFKILQSKLAWAMVPYLDEIFVVIAGLVNLSPPILSDDKFMTVK